MQGTFHLTNHAVRRIIQRGINMRTFQIVRDYGTREMTDNGALIIKGLFEELKKFGRKDVEKLNIVVRGNNIVTAYYAR